MTYGKALKRARQRDKLILALLQQPTLEKAAVIAGMSPTTAWRISKTPEFEEEYRQARWDCVEQGLGRMQQNFRLAAVVVQNVMVDPATPPGVRLKAALGNLHFVAEAIKAEDLRARAAEVDLMMREERGAPGNKEGLSIVRSMRGALKWTKPPKAA